VSGVLACTVAFAALDPVIAQSIQDAYDNLGAYVVVMIGGAVLVWAVHKLLHLFL
jgi:hypothetical protein